MHEMSLMQDVLEIIEDAAREKKFGRVKTVWLEIGALSGVDPQAVNFCFDAVMQGSVASGAILEILHKPGLAWCMKCGKQVEISARFDACELCGSFELQVTGGDGMRVKELEVE